MKHGLNSGEMQKKNRELIIRLLLDNKSMTRTQLASVTGLQKATITNIINEFIELNLIRVDGENAAGRRAESIALQFESYILILGITRKDYQIVIYTLNGQRKADFCATFEIGRDRFYSVFEQMKAKTVELLGKVDQSKVICACLTVPGLFIRNTKEKVEKMEITGFEELEKINLRAEFEAILDVPFLMYHDAKLDAYAEWRVAPEAKKNRNASLAIIRSRGGGLGTGMVINGKIVEGHLGVAGEVGYMGINYNGRLMPTYSAGSFEYCASTDSAIRYMLERLFEYPESCLHEGSTYQEIVTAYENGDSLAAYAVEKMAWMLGYGIANIIYMVNPDCIVIGADYPHSTDFVNKVKKSVARMVDPLICQNTVIRYSEVQGDPCILGGYYYVIETLFKDGKMLEILGIKC